MDVLFCPVVVKPVRPTPEPVHKMSLRGLAGFDLQGTKPVLRFSLMKCEHVSLFESLGNGQPSPPSSQDIFTGSEKCEGIRPRLFWNNVEFKFFQPFSSAVLLQIRGPLGRGEMRHL